MEKYFPFHDRLTFITPTRNEKTCIKSSPPQEDERFRIFHTFRMDKKAKFVKVCFLIFKYNSTFLWEILFSQ